MKTSTRTRHFIVLSFLLLFVLAGCAGMNTSQRRVFTGTAVGVGTGALLGEVTGGNPAAGAVIGGAVGALGGYLYDQSSNNGRHYYNDSNRNDRYRYNNRYNNQYDNRYYRNRYRY